MIIYSLLSIILQIQDFFYNVSNTVLIGMPSQAVEAFAFLLLVTLPTAVMYVFVAYRKYIMFAIGFLWFLFIMAIIL